MSPTGFPDAPELCLAAFDELQALGLEGFARRHDPYWDVPLVGALPEPTLSTPDRTPAERQAR